MKKAMLEIEMLEGIIATVREPLLVLSPDLRVISANSSFYTTFQVNPRETEGCLLYELGNRQWDIPALRKLLEEILPKRNEFNDYEIKHNFQTIGSKIMLLNARRIAQKEKKLILLAIEDVSERKIAEALAMEKSRLEIAMAERKRGEASLRRLAAVVIDSNDAITVQDLEGKISEWNRGAERMYGYTESEARAMNIQETIPEAKRQETLEFIAAAAAVPSFETQRVTKDGRTLDVWMTVTKLTDEAGKSVGIATTERDITERKRAEEKVVEEKANLEKVNLELDSFVYTASHDLRAPLRAVSSFASFLEEDYKDRLDEAGRDHLLEIQKGVGRMTRLIDDLLTLSRMSRVQNPYENVNMNQLVENAKGRLEFDLKEKGAQLHIQSKLPTVYCDRIKMEEVFVNLLSNAVKFSSKNNRVPKIEVGTQETKDEHEFYVADNGIGIEPRFHAQIFELFKRLHTQEEYEGTGAGLSIVKRIIEDHKGRIWVESDLGKSTKFIFTIPKNLNANGGATQ